jgi:hypothetical protein
MAKMKTSSPSILRTDIDPLLGTIGSQGQQILRAPTNNRFTGVKSGTQAVRVPSPLFASVDSLIFNLDATYDLLPDKSPWEILALEIAGEWSLCANCVGGDSAKKLYRQTNFNRQLLGLPRTDIPLSTYPFDTTSDGAAIGTGGAPGGTVVLTGVGVQFVQVFYILQLGRGLNNTIIPVGPAVVYWYLSPGDAGYSDLQPLPPGSTVSFCTCDSGGSPGRNWTLTCYA